MHIQHAHALGSRVQLRCPCMFQHLACMQAGMDAITFARSSEGPAARKRACVQIFTYPCMYARMFTIKQTHKHALACARGLLRNEAYFSRTCSHAFLCPWRPRPVQLSPRSGYVSQSSVMAHHMVAFTQAHSQAQTHASTHTCWHARTYARTHARMRVLVLVCSHASVHASCTDSSW